MKTTIELNGFEIVIEETEDGLLTVSALKDGETVEEFTLETGDDESSEFEGEEDSDELKAFGEEEDDFEDAEDAQEDEDDDMEEVQDDDMEEVQDDEEEPQNVEEFGKMESFESFIRKMK
jgi:hypothetical protein